MIKLQKMKEKGRRYREKLHNLLGKIFKFSTSLKNLAKSLISNNPQQF